MEFDPFSETFFDDPYETYRYLRDNGPVYLGDGSGFYTLSRYADVLAAHQDNERFVSFDYGVTVDGLMEHRRLDTNILIIMDPPEHDRQRKLVSQAFTVGRSRGSSPLCPGDPRLPR